MQYWDFSVFYKTVINGNTALKQSTAVSILLGPCTFPMTRAKAAAFVSGKRRLPHSIVTRVTDRSGFEQHGIIQKLELHNTFACIQPLISSPSLISNIVDEKTIERWRKLSEEGYYEDVFIDAFLLAVKCPYNLEFPSSLSNDMGKDDQGKVEQEEKKRESNMVIDHAKRKVFIVHGHDDSAKYEVALTLNRLGLEAIILHEQPDIGLTIIEKIERYSDVEFAVVLYTECDLGRSKEDNVDTEQYRARQNVVFEHGYLLGRLGRGHVCALVKGKIETPGDISGVVYTKMDTAGGWKLRLIKNLQAIGIDVDTKNIS